MKVKLNKEVSTLTLISRALFTFINKLSNFVAYYYTRLRNFILAYKIRLILTLKS